MSEAPPTSAPPPGAQPLWGSYKGNAPVAAPVSQKWTHGPQKRHSPGGERLEPLSVRLLQAAGVLSLLLILVVVNSLLNRGSQSPFNPNPVAAAAERTADVPGMRMTMTMRFIGESTSPITVTGRGVYNGETNLAEMTYDGTTSQGQRLQFDAVLGESGWYFRYPQLARKLPEGKEWVKIDGLPGQKDMSAPGVASPDESLQMLRAAGSVHRLGRTKIGRVRTARYRVTLTAAEITESLRSQGKEELAEAFEGVSSQVVGPVRYLVFIDGRGFLRRMWMTSITAAEGKQVTTEMRMNFSDFGIEPNILTPDDSRVLDAPQLEEGLDQLGQAS